MSMCKMYILQPYKLQQILKNFIYETIMSQYSDMMIFKWLAIKLLVFIASCIVNSRVNSRAISTERINLSLSSALKPSSHLKKIDSL